MRTLLVLAGAAAALTLAACGAGDGGQARTVTVARETTPAQTPPEQHKKPAEKRQARAAHKAPSPAAPTYTACDANITVKSATTTCPFAENVFYEYWYSWNYHEMEAFAAYSPAVSRWFDMACRGASQIVCVTGNDGHVRFPMQAVEAYTEKAATAYAADHTVSVTPEDNYDSSPSEPDASGGSGGSGESGGSDGSEGGDASDPYSSVPYDRDCSDFSQTDFPTPPGDPDGLDADGDGIACES
jgi:hypothetical protein